MVLNTHTFIDGCSHYSAADLSRKDYVAGSVTMIPGFSGTGQAFQAPAGLAYSAWTSGPTSYYFRARFKTRQVGIERTIVKAERSTVEFQNYLGYDSSGALFFERPINGVNPGQRWTSTVTLSPNTEYDIEIACDIHSTTGKFEVRLDGAGVAGLIQANIDTAASTVNNRVDRIRLDNPSGQYQDLIVSVGTSAYVQADFLSRSGGGPYVATLRPNASGATNQWTNDTGGAGAHYLEVQDTLADLDTTRLSTVTLNQRESHGFTSLPANAATVALLQYGAMHRRRVSTAGSQENRTFRIGGVNYDSGSVLALSPITISTEWHFGREIHLVSPATSSPWTVAEINAMEAGMVRTGASTSNEVYLSQVILEVLWYPPPPAGDFEFESFVQEQEFYPLEPFVDVAAAQFPRFVDLAEKLWPRGRAWHHEPDSMTTAVLESIAHEGSIIEAQVEKMARETDPSRTSELLPEWERALRLPDPCLGPDLTDDQRRASVLDRLVGLQGVSTPELTDYLAGLGYAVTLSHFKVCKAGSALAGEPCLGIGWAFTLAVTYWGSGDRARLECAVRNVMPAHAEVVFYYGEFEPAIVFEDTLFGPLDSITP